MNKRNTWLNCWAIGDLLQLCSTEDPTMGGLPMTFTLDVITKAQQYACTRSKMVIALVGTPRLSGHLTDLCISKIMMECYLTSLVAVISPLKILEWIYSA